MKSKARLNSTIKRIKLNMSSSAVVLHWKNWTNSDFAAGNLDITDIDISKPKSLLRP